MAKIDPTGSYVLFDGVCNVCNHWVQFIIKRDPHAKFQFASLQSAEAGELLHAHGKQVTLDSIVLVQQEKVYTESTAILHILRQLRGIWKVAGVGLIIPEVIRNALYRWFARNRYRWFGQRESCMLPTPEIRLRFF
jgi:predicted DCC family thiol-disulfide oxidoreductase YuxK